MKTQKSKKWIMYLIAAIIVVAVIVTAGVVSRASGASSEKVSCSACEGTGLCHDCYNTGVCSECGGSGKTEDYYGNEADCDSCAGNGVCASCEGTKVCAECEGAGEVGASSNLFATWWALVPPILAIGLALVTKEVYSSLLVGIVAGAIMYSNFSFTGTMDTIINDGIIGAVSGTAGIFIFLVELGIIVALINKAGGSAAFGAWAKKHIKTRVGAIITTFILGILIFIDDYFNCLTVGSVMRPVTDSHNVSRAKLSYIIDATAAPICMIAPISSWAAAVASYAKGSEYGSFELFVRAIPYNFYSLLTLVFIVAITVMKFDFGPMRVHEVNAKTKGDLYTCGDKNESEEVEPSSKGKVVDLIFPIAVLIGLCIFALLYVGGIMSGANIIDAFGDTDATVGLPWGGLIALVLIIVYLMLRKVVSFKEAMASVPKGFIAMVPAILILTFATALKNMTGILGATEFVDSIMSNGAVAGLTNFLPAIIFLIACGLSFSTGTSWGTFGILIPIVLAIFNGDSGLMIIGMSACLAGSVCGDHCSPISDTTIMSSAGGQCNHINHVSTQLPYAISVAAISFVMYIVAGLVQNVLIVLPLGIAITIGFLFVMKAIMKKLHGKEI